MASGIAPELMQTFQYAVERKPPILQIKRLLAFGSARTEIARYLF
jgi:hypothetical protein